MAQAAQSPVVAPSGAPDLVDRMLAGDERAFADAVGEHGPRMLRLARVYVASEAVAEEVVQEAWLRALRGLGAFERRSSLRTWLLRIVVNCALARGERERRTTPFSSVAARAGDARFLEEGRWADCWAGAVRRWDGLPEQRLASAEALRELRRHVAELPPRQAAVLVLRDAEGLSADEVSELLGVSRANQRVLLHRARTRMRELLEPRAEGTGPC